MEFYLHPYPQLEFSLADQKRAPHPGGQTRPRANSRKKADRRNRAHSKRANRRTK